MSSAMQPLCALGSSGRLDCNELQGAAPYGSAAAGVHHPRGRPDCVGWRHVRLAKRLGE